MREEFGDFQSVVGEATRTAMENFTTYEKKKVNLTIGRAENDYQSGKVSQVDAINKVVTATQKILASKITR